MRNRQYHNYHTVTCLCPLWVDFHTNHTKCNSCCQPTDSQRSWSVLTSTRTNPVRGSVLWAEKQPRWRREKVSGKTRWNHPRWRWTVTSCNVWTYRQTELRRPPPPRRRRHPFSSLRRSIRNSGSTVRRGSWKFFSCTGPGRVLNSRFSWPVPRC